jgi:drug/metabolite transporter (DMT)-like permease
VGPFLLVSLRLLFGILGLLAAALITRAAWPRDRRTWLALTFLGLINNALPYTLISWGEKYIDSAVAAILNSTTPLFTMVIANFFVADDKMTPRRAAALLGGFAGVVVLVSRDAQAGKVMLTGNLIGQGAVLLAALSYATATVYARRTTHGLPPPVQAVMPLLGADLLLWALAPVVEAPLALPHKTLTWLAILWLGLMGVMLAYFLYFYLLHSVGPTRTMLVSYIFPLVGVALGIIFLHEQLDWRLAAGAILVVGSIVVVNA